jgi:type II secretory pathway pseudopilin PulG
MRRRAAFTLLELLVVMGIITLAVALLMPALTKLRESAKRQAVKTDLAKFEAGIAEYKRLQNRLPPNLDVLDLELARGNGNGPYVDPWGMPYAYIVRPDLYVVKPTDPPARTGISPNFGMKYYTDAGKPIRHAVYNVISSGSDKIFGPGGDWTPGVGAWAPGQPGADDIANFNRSEMLDEKHW